MIVPGTSFVRMTIMACLRLLVVFWAATAATPIYLAMIHRICCFRSDAIWSHSRLFQTRKSIRRFVRGIRTHLPTFEYSVLISCNSPSALGKHFLMFNEASWMLPLGCQFSVNDPRLSWNAPEMFPTCFWRVSASIMPALLFFIVFLCAVAGWSAA